MRKWLCVKSGNSRWFLEGKKYTETTNGTIDELGYKWSISLEDFNSHSPQWYFKELTFQSYVEQCERLVDSGLLEGKGI